MARKPTAEERAKIEAGPKYDPGKPKPTWKERPPEPKPPVPPKPPAPPTLEPVIAQPYVPPVGGKAVDWAHLKGSPDPEAADKTKPTILKTPDGVLHYTPHHKTMWGELGMRTDKDYSEYLATGKASQYVGITEGVDKPMLVSRRELAKASELKGEAQFQALKDVGAIPSGAKFLPGPGGYQGTDWTWLHPDTMKKTRGQILARLARRSTKKPRVVIPPLKVRPTPPYREKRPVPAALIKHPAYLELRPATRGMIEDPEAVVEKLGKEPTLTNIEDIINEWHKAREWFDGIVDPIKAKFVKELGGTEQKEYFDKLGVYNSQVLAYNAEIKKFEVTAGQLEKAGALLPLGLVTKYNDDMARLNALSLSLEREGAGVNLESEGAVRLFNKKVDNLNKDFDALDRQTERVNTSIREVDGFNVKVDKFNIAIESLIEPQDPPPEPPRTVGNIARALYEGTIAEYKKAAREGLTLKEKSRNVSLLTAEVLVPGVWAYGPYTGRTLSDMIKEGKYGEIALNVALDMLIVIPVAKIGVGLAKVALRGAAKTAVKQALKVETKLVQQSIKAMRKAYGKGAALSLKKVSKLQADYLNQLAKLERLKVKGRATTQQLGKTLATENQLRAAARQFTLDIQAAQTRLGRKGVIGAGFDSPDVARAFYGLPENIARHTQQAFKAIAKPKVKQSIKKLEADVAKAEATLQAAKAKATFDASSWVDLVDDLMVKQALLSQRKAGSLANMQQQLAGINKELAGVKGKILEATLKPPPKIAGKAKVIQRRILAKYQAQRQLLKRTEFNLQRRRQALMQRLHSGIKTMEVDWGRGGAVGRGRGVATAVKPRGAPPTLTSGAAVVTPTTATMTAAQAAAMATITGAIIKVVGKPIPEVAEIVKGLTDVEVIRAVEAAALKAIRTAEKLALKPAAKVSLATRQRLATELAQRVKLQLRTAAKVAPSAKIASAIKTKIAPITAAAKAVGVKVPEKLIPLPVPPLKPKLIPRLLPSKGTEKQKRDRIKKAKGAIAWRHGELHGKDIFHVGLYPYTSEENYLTVVGRKPAGATIVKGPGSARQSIRLLYGKSPPRTVRGDIGFFDFVITPTGPKRVGIEFKPDPQMQTRGDVTLGKRMPPITERRGSLGRGKGLRITPKTPRLRR